MNPIIYNLKNKLTWMSSQLRQINRAWEIQAWISAMKDIHSLLEETAKNKELLQIPKTSKHLSLPKKFTSIRSTKRSISRENSLKDVDNLQPVHRKVGKEVSLELDNSQAAHPLVDKDISPEKTKNAVQRLKRHVVKESSSKSLTIDPQMTEETEKPHIGVYIDDLEMAKPPNVDVEEPSFEIKEEPADIKMNRYFEKWRQALWQELDDYGWDSDFYEDKAVKELLDTISDETGLTGHKTNRELLDFLLKESQRCLNINRPRLRQLLPI